MQIVALEGKGEKGRRLRQQGTKKDPEERSRPAAEQKRKRKRNGSASASPKEKGSGLTKGGGARPPWVEGVRGKKKDHHYLHQPAGGKKKQELCQPSSPP